VVMRLLTDPNNVPASINGIGQHQGGSPTYDSIPPHRVINSNPSYPPPKDAPSAQKAGEWVLCD
jgi:hypothetical protein